VHNKAIFALISALTGEMLFSEQHLESLVYCLLQCAHHTLLFLPAFFLLVAFSSLTSDFDVLSYACGHVKEVNKTLGTNL
jgi:hypothetical protein